MKKEWIMGSSARQPSFRDFLQRFEQRLQRFQQRWQQLEQWLKQRSKQHLGVAFQMLKEEEGSEIEREILCEARDMVGQDLFNALLSEWEANRTAASTSVQEQDTVLTTNTMKRPNTAFE